MVWFDEEVGLDVVNKSPTPLLDAYTENLNEKIARAPADYRAYDRDKEIEKVELSLMRRAKNSPLLVGDAGVGKTAIVEGFVLAILENQVDESLAGLTVRSLELSSLMEDTEGGFIVKFKRIIEELIATSDENILFIDEIHTLVGVGGEGSYLDAGNVLKPALARGEIKLIGATTQEEYHQSIERDKALERRFQPIYVAEPTVQEAIAIAQKAKTKFERFQGVTFTPEAVEQAVYLSVRYVPERYLPDKAFDLLDEASALGKKDGKKVITEVDIAQVLKERTGIPVTTILRTDEDRLLDISERLTKRVKGQPDAIRSVSDAVVTFKAGMQDEDRPASFLFMGTTGVGKTELAKSLAEVLFDDENAMIRLDMSEFSQAEDAKRLIGTPSQPGLLTEPVKRKPYSVILIDEIEKGHGDVHNLLLQVLDDGRLTNSLGRLINFKNTVVIMTTNIGAEKIQNDIELKGAIDKWTDREYAQFLAGIEVELKTEFRPEFVNRIDYTVVFQMLDEPVIKEIAEKKLEQVAYKLARHKLQLTYSPDLLDYLAANGTDAKNGARPLNRLIKKKVEAPISWELLKQGSQSSYQQLEILVQGEAPNGYDRILDRRWLEFRFY